MSVLSELVGALQILPDDRDGCEFFNRIGQNQPVGECCCRPVARVLAEKINPSHFFSEIPPPSMSVADGGSVGT